jgi:tetratricopeptide (TPR) repeat protein
MLRLAGVLAFFWGPRGQVIEGKRWLEQALAGATPTNSIYRARALRGLAHLHGESGDLASADALLQESLRIYQELGDEDGIGRCLNNLGFNAWRQGSAPKAKPLFEQSLAIRRDAVPLGNLTHLALAEGDLAHARTRAEETLDLATEAQNDDISSLARRDLASITALEQRYVAAADLTRELLNEARRGDSPSHTVACVLLAAFIAWKQGNANDAARLVRSAASERLRLGMPSQEPAAYPHVGALVRGLQQDGYDLTKGETLSLEDAAKLALRCLEPPGFR